MSAFKKKKTIEEKIKPQGAEMETPVEGEKISDQAVKESEKLSTDKESKEPKAPKKRSKFVSFLIALLAGLVLLAIGAGAVYFGLYSPKTTELTSEVTTTTTELTAANAEIERLKGVESSLTADLTDANEEIASLTTDLDKAKALRSIYQIQSNVNVARYALEKGDDTQASQALEYIISNIQNLTVPAFPNITENLEARLTTIRTTIVSDKVKAQTDLEALFNDLLLLADNVK